MLQKFVGLLMISLVNGNTMTWLPQSITQSREIVDWAAKINAMIDNHQNETDMEINTRMLEHVNESSNLLDVLSRRLQIECAQILVSLSSEILSEDFLLAKDNLCKNINKVDRFFEKSRKYGLSTSFGEQRLSRVGHKVLWGDGNLPETLDAIRVSMISDRYNSGSLGLIYQESMRNIQYDCDSHSSAQQKVYYIYVLLIIAEMKGLLTYQKIYLTRRLAPENSHKYVAELDYARRNFEKRVNEYHNTIVGNMDPFSRLVRRCNVESSDLGNDIIELRKLSRFTLLITSSFASYTCGSPSESELGEISVRRHTKIYNCMSLGTTVTFCPAEFGSHREYLWWKDVENIYYGHNTPCQRTGLIGTTATTYHGPKPAHFYSQSCVVSACSEDQNIVKAVGENTNWRISVADQISDLSNNMVVTGVKFAVYDHTLHLRIYQANFSHDGLVDNLGMWKELNVGPFNHSINQTKMNMSDELLHYNRKTLYLDDIRVPEGTVITGVRFRAAGDTAFKLQVQATPFNFETGELTPSGSNWLDASTNPMRPIDYEHQRIEINLDNSDDPTKCTEFDYDLTSNKLVKFTHTDIHKDAGQTTIPLLDAQPVITQPSFPLSGIGLAFSGKKGFGGYVTPRIYTVGITKYLRSDW